MIEWRLQCFEFQLVTQLKPVTILYLFFFQNNQFQHALEASLAIYLYYKVGCVFVCQHSNVQMLASPPILKLWDTQGYLWLCYDLMEVIKLIGVTFKQKN